MKFVLYGILVGAVGVTVGVAIAEHIRKQRKIENVSDLTDRLARQLATLERDLLAARDSVLADSNPSNGVVKKKTTRAPRPRQA